MMKQIMEVVLNFSSKIVFFVILFVSLKVYSLDVKSIYLSSCHRETGVVTSVTGSYLYMITTKGRIKKLPRYEIVGIATYPIEKFPTTSLTTAHHGQVKMFQITTLYKGDFQVLVTGWPISYSEQKITFLSSKGEEVTFDRSHIWEINQIQSQKQYKFQEVTKKYDFLHPTSLSKCAKKKGRSKKNIQVSPQDYTSDPIVIKRRFDNQIKQIKKLSMYERTQDFYAVPEIYKTETALGMWTFSGSRYGASNNRANNWTPTLENQFSSGPFGYQHLFLTGANTNQFFVHEEPQTQIFYSFKADYFHLSYFLDPSLLLMGKRYRWFEDELDQYDYKMTDMSFIEMGFDFGHFSLLMQMSSEIQLGYIDYENYVYDGSLTLPKYGLQFKNHKFYFNFLTGDSSENVKSDDLKDSGGNNIGYKISEFKFSVARFNFGQVLNDKWKYQLSYITRSITDGHNEMSSQTYASEIGYSYSYKYKFKLLTSIESNTHEETQQFLKLGISANLIF